MDSAWPLSSNPSGISTTNFGGSPELEAPSCINDDLPSQEPRTDGMARIMRGISIIKWHFCRLRTDKVKSAWTAMKTRRNTFRQLSAYDSLRLKEIVHLKNRKSEALSVCAQLVPKSTLQVNITCQNYIFIYGFNKTLKTCDGSLDHWGGLHSIESLFCINEQTFIFVA